MEMVKVSFENEWIVYSAVLEVTSDQHAPARLEQLLRAHMALPMARFGLENGSDKFVVKAEIPRFLNTGRSCDLESAMIEGAQLCRKVLARARMRKGRTASHDAALVAAAGETILAAADESGWACSSASPDDGGFIAGETMYSISAPDAAGRPGEMLSASIGGGGVAFTLPLGRFPRQSSSEQTAMCLYLLRMNSVLRLARTGILHDDAVLSVRYPLQGFLPVECREAVRAMNAARSVLLPQVRAIRHRAVADAYLHHTSTKNHSQIGGD